MADPLGERLKEFQERVAKDPENAVLRFDLGAYLVRLREYEKAIPELQKAATEPACRQRAMDMLSVVHRILGLKDDGAG